MRVMHLELSTMSVPMHRVILALLVFIFCYNLGPASISQQSQAKRVLWGNHTGAARRLPFVGGSVTVARAGMLGLPLRSLESSFRTSNYATTW